MISRTTVSPPTPESKAPIAASRRCHNSSADSGSDATADGCQFGRPQAVLARRRGLDMGHEQAMRPLMLPHHLLGMPLHRHDKRVAIALQAFDNIVRRPGHSTQARSNLADRLVVGGIDPHPVRAN